MINKIVCILLLSFLQLGCESEYYANDFGCVAKGKFKYRQLAVRITESESDDIFIQDVENIDFYNINENLKNWINEYPYVRKDFSIRPFGNMLIFDKNYKEEYILSHHSRASISFDSTSKGYSIRNIMIWNETKKNFDFVIIKN